MPQRRRRRAIRVICASPSATAWRSPHCHLAARAAARKSPNWRFASSSCLAQQLGPAQRSAGHRLCAVGRGERRPCRRAVWTDPLSVIVPVRHPLLAHAEVPLDEALKFPLVLCHPDAGSGCHHQIQAVLQGASKPLAGRSGDEPRRDADSGRCRLWPRFRHCLAGADPEPPRHNQPAPWPARRPCCPPTCRRSAEPSEPMKRFLQRPRSSCQREMNRPRDVERSGTLATAGCPWLALDLLGARVDQAWFFSP